MSNEWEVRCCCHGSLLGYLPGSNAYITLVHPVPFEEWVTRWKAADTSIEDLPLETTTIEWSTWAPNGPRFVSKARGKPWMRAATVIEMDQLGYHWPTPRRAWRSMELSATLLARLPGWRPATLAERALDPANPALAWIPPEARIIMERLEAGEPPAPEHLEHWEHSEHPRTH